MDERDRRKEETKPHRNDDIYTITTHPNKMMIKSCGERVQHTKHTHTPERVKKNYLYILCMYDIVYPTFHDSVRKS